jgi:hypothetical protein
MKENKFSLSAISIKSTIVHTVSYFVIGILALTFLDYSAKFADPIVANMFRQTDHPLVAAGPLFQVLRGFLFGVVFYFLREIIFPRKNGWLLLLARLRVPSKAWYTLSYQPGFTLSAYPKFLFNQGY